MKEQNFYAAGQTRALDHAIEILKKRGVSFCDSPSAKVTHLLLGVPAFRPDGGLQGKASLEQTLARLPDNVTVVGGNLNVPALIPYNKVDLLTDPLYLAKNARITAYCAVRQAMDRLPITLWQCPVLVVGWGRIGKCLAQLLKQMGAQVTVAARKETDLAALISLGYPVTNSECLSSGLLKYRIIFNTAPAMVLPQEAVCSADCLKIDLASRQGIGGQDVIWARGLPNKDAPESSGALIADTILRLTC